MPVLKTGISSYLYGFINPAIDHYVYRNGYYYLFWGNLSGGKYGIFYSYATSIAGLASASSNLLALGAGAFDNYYLSDVEYAETPDVIGLAWTWTNGAFSSPYYAYCTFNSNGSLSLSSISIIPLSQAIRPNISYSEGMARWLLVCTRTFSAPYTKYAYISSDDTPEGATDWVNILTINTGALTTQSSCGQIVATGNNRFMYLEWDGDYVWYNIGYYASGVANWLGFKQTSIKTLGLYGGGLGSSNSKIRYSSDLDVCVGCLNESEAPFTIVETFYIKYDFKSDKWTTYNINTSTTGTGFRSNTLCLYNNNVISIHHDITGGINIFKLFNFNLYNNTITEYSGYLTGELAASYPTCYVSITFTKEVSSWTDGIANGETCLVWAYVSAGTTTIMGNKIDLTATFSIDFNGNPQRGLAPLNVNFEQSNIVTVTIS